jgi:hypothetical protein
VKEAGFKNFMCVCNALFKDEPSYRAHANATHKQVNDLICQFQDVIEMTSLQKVDFGLLGDDAPREPFADLLGDIKEQKARIIKWMWLRGTVLHSDQTIVRSESDRIATRIQGKKKQRAVARESRKRQKALDVLNSDLC